MASTPPPGQKLDFQMFVHHSPQICKVLFEIRQAHQGEF